MYPSPAKNNATLSLNLVQNETITLNVVNTVGQVVYTEVLSNLNAGSHAINLNTENWANGIYNITLGSTQGSTSIKLVVEK